MSGFQGKEKMRGMQGREKERGKGTQDQALPIFSDTCDVKPRNMGTVICHGKLITWLLASNEREALLKQLHQSCERSYFNL